MTILPMSQSPHKRLLQASALVLGAWVAAACSGRVSQPDDETKRPTMGGGGGGGQSVSPSDPPSAAASVMPMLRLTRDQYRNAVADLLGVDAGEGLSAAARGDSGFAQAPSISATEVRALLDNAEAVAATIVKNMTPVTKCANGKQQDVACATRFIRDFGRRAYRRPVLPDEQQDLLALYATGMKELGLDHHGALALIVEAMLQSPAFLYRWELGPVPAPKPKDGLLELNQFELASRLSFFLWNATPDPALAAAADAGQLNDADAVAAHVDRMLADPKAKAAFRGFAEDWLHIRDLPMMGKNEQKFPEFKPALRRAMVDETADFVASAVLDENGTFAGLMTAPWTFVKADVAAIYGADISGSGAGGRATLNPKRRAGLLTHPSLLAHGSGPAFASPTRRGQIIREQILCQPVPPPGPDVDTSVVEGASSSDVRARYEAHATNPRCRSCHQLMDPLGFAFGRYNAIGKYDDAPQADDTGGVLEGAGDADGPFTDAITLAERLGASDEAFSCFARQMLRFALGRAEAEQDAASLDKVLEGAGGARSLRALITALVATPAFSHRALSPKELAQ